MLTAKKRRMSKPCSVCGKIFSASSALVYHMRLHSNYRPYKCQVCGKSFIQKIHLIKHLEGNAHTRAESEATESNQPIKEENEEMQRSIFDSATLKSLDLDFGKQHDGVATPKGSESGHGNQSQSPKLPFCRKARPSFENRGDLVKCPHCPELLRGQLRFLEHICSVHQSIPTFQSSQEPPAGHSAGPNKPLAAARKDTWCRICEANFSCQDALSSHMQSHAEGKSYDCEICGREFLSESSLITHSKMHTEESQQCVCQICGKEFSSRRTLKVHIRIHTGERPYPCKFCERSFIQRVHLIRHVASHIRQAGPHSTSDGKVQNNSALRSSSPKSINESDFFDIKHEPEESSPPADVSGICASRDLIPSTSNAVTIVSSWSESKHQPTADSSKLSGSSSSCQSCALMKSELDLLKAEMGILKQFLSGKLNLMEQKVDGMKDMLNLG